MATAIATPLLKFALEKAAGAAVSKLMDKGLNYINGGSDADKIQRSIGEMFKEVQEIKLAVNEMAKKLDEGILRLRKDNLNAPLTDIESYYAGVQDCIDGAYEAKEKIKDKAELEKKLQRLQTRLEAHLKMAVEHVPSYLGRANDFLQEKDFLNGAASLALNGSEDFLAYYMKMKILFVPYWVVFVKGITMLVMAQNTPNVAFDEAPQTIKRLSQKVAEQEQAFTNAVGKNTCDLSEFILAAPNQRRPFIWFSGWGANIECVSRLAAPLVHHNVPRVRTESGQHKYLLEVLTSVDPRNFDLSKSYPMRIWADQGSDHIERSNDRLPVYMWPGGFSASAWFIKPISTGSNCYRFIGADGEGRGSVLITGWNENRLEYKWGIATHTGYDGRQDRAYFQLIPARA
ncbi:hypothetical protein B0T16DRAFT_450715 [Cercophora newfieldiana]|uniref:Uncharacterized protein n=1 Tax=Cercophora newfieldiana TaxID=92897 RepID=A0AA39YM70_9PEZI|nr:hypothetical protein B0T16DRAFT_450715 [Cercophora newfieldiana]